MTKWTFTFDGIKGRAERTHNALFIVWGGMGFHFNAANDAMRNAILSAEVKASQNDSGLVSMTAKNCNWM